MMTLNLNLTTAEEAKEMWCPFARVTLAVAEPSSSWNRRADLNVPSAWSRSYCISADCMAWRWFNATHGFCGLAGRPS